MQNHLKYLKYVLLHKWYVFWECLIIRAGVWRAIRHDWTKFTRTEWGPYMRWFYARPIGPKPWIQECKNQFMEAWRSHVTKNDHHWEFWTKRTDGKMYATVMPDKCVREMVADWRGVCRAKGQSREMAVVWYMENIKKVALHPFTRDQVEFYLGIQLAGTYEHSKTLLGKGWRQTCITSEGHSSVRYCFSDTVEVPEPVYRMPGS